MPNPIRDKDVAEQISKLYDLHQSGALSDLEFENAKRRVLGDPPPRMVAKPAPTYDRSVETKVGMSPLRRGVFIICGFVIAAIVISGLLSDSSDDDSGVALAPTQSTVNSPSGSPTVIIEPSATSEPTATAILRTGIQAIHLSITVQNDWKAWGQGCVGDGPLEWAGSDAGVVVVPEDATGTARGVELGTGALSPDGSQCQWSAMVTSRASDTYRIHIGGHNAYCHSSMMLPTDDGFFAAVILNEDGVECATVLGVSDGTTTPATTSTP